MSWTRQNSQLRKALGAFFAALETAGYDYPANWLDPDDNEAQTAALVEAGLKTWLMACAGTPPERVLSAGLQWLRQDRYRKWPMPGHVMLLVDDAGSTSMTGDEAWGFARRLTGTNDTKRTKLCGPESIAEAQAAYEAGKDARRPFVPHPDPSVTRCLVTAIDALGGWRAFGLMQENDVAANRASFRTVFNAAMARERNREQVSTMRQTALVGAAIGLLPDFGPNWAEGEESVARYERELAEAHYGG